MTKSKYTKGITLTFFITLIAAFLVYRAGYFDKYIYSQSADLQSCPNGGTISQLKKDSLHFRQDSLPRKKVMFSSSKSVVVTDEINFKQKPEDTVTLTKEELHLMSSSKSAVIFHPKPNSKPNPNMEPATPVMDSVFLKGAKKKP